jgi:cell wall-associated NlpC family hydrolase
MGVVAGSVVTLVASLLLQATTPVGADPLGSARAQAAQIASQLHADGARLDALSQQYENALQQLAAVNAQIAQVRGAIAQDQAQVAADESGLRQEALSNYETGATVSGLTVIGGGGEKAAAADEYQSLAAGDMSTAVDTLRQAESHLGQQQAQLQASLAQAQAALAQAAAARNAALATSASEQSTLRSVNGQIAQLVAAQQAPRPLPGIGAGIGNPPPNGAAGRAVQAAESQIGVPYQWGAESPGVGFDCSGLTQWSWGQAGVSIPRTAQGQYNAVAHVPMSSVEPGDLIFWASGGSITHVGIYVGNGDVVHAPSTGGRVRIEAIWPSGLVGAGRP